MRCHRFQYFSLNCFRRTSSLDSIEVVVLRQHLHTHCAGQMQSASDMELCGAGLTHLCGLFLNTQSYGITPPLVSDGKRLEHWWTPQRID
jgi:hypothetical protein